MNKKELKDILMSMQTPENKSLINYILGEIDVRDEDAIIKATARIGENEEAVREFLNKKLEERIPHQNKEQYPLNAMFTYGISGDCIHLHLPTDLHELIAKNGVSKAVATVNLHLLDALYKIKDLRDHEFYRFEGKNSVFMISPIVIKREMQFLEKLDFITRSYDKKQLSDEEFIKQNPEAQLAVRIFGKNRNVGTASIGLDTICSEEWQQKRREVVKRIEEQGISMENSSEKVC